MSVSPSDLARELAELYCQRIGTGHSERSAVAAMMELYLERLPGCADFYVREAVAHVVAECRLKLRSEGKFPRYQ
jgi:hypothetical protein